MFWCEVVVWSWAVDGGGADIEDSGDTGSGGFADQCGGAVVVDRGGLFPVCSDVGGCVDQGVDALAASGEGIGLGQITDQLSGGGWGWVADECAELDVWSGGQGAGCGGADEPGRSGEQDTSVLVWSGALVVGHRYSLCGAQVEDPGQKEPAGLVIPCRGHC